MEWQSIEVEQVKVEVKAVVEEQGYVTMVEKVSVEKAKVVPEKAGVEKLGVVYAVEETIYSF